MKTKQAMKYIALLFFTLRHLKAVQFYWRIYLKLLKLKPFNKSIAKPIGQKKLNLVSPISKQQYFEPYQFSFLNHSASANVPVDWNDSSQTKLWLYNLHYFDYINQYSIDKNIALNFITDWIIQNKVGIGNGWEPYTLSLRIVNWIKFLSHLNSDTDLTSINCSLYLQCRFLFEHLEYHLLGNHLFKNGVALVFAGSYFQEREAEIWLHTGLDIINRQIREQILNDGGHFERSPMYHSLILEDILDCLNVHQAKNCFSTSEAESITQTALRMLNFLTDTIHEDGDIAFFNDSALNIAPQPCDIFDYALRLGLNQNKTTLSIASDSVVSLIEKTDFGVYVLQNKIGKMIFDAGPIGPDYLPGHAHCDTLSYELDIAGYRCIVNSGTYQYAGHDRNKFRATAAHNTLRLDLQEQHEIWSTFRVARRGYPFNIRVCQQQEFIRLSAAHSGYKRLPGKPVHSREIICNSDSWEINDRVESSEAHCAESFIHLHPDVAVISRSSSKVLCELLGNRFLISALKNSTFDFEDSVYSPEFGLKQLSSVLVLRKQGNCPIYISYKIALI